MQNIIHPKLGKSVNNWFEAKFNGLTLPFYSSIDLRNSGYKIAPVDANLFPAGFNNLSEESKITAAKLVKSYFEKHQYKKALIIPENYTRNKIYIENVFAIEEILREAGFETKVGLFNNEINDRPLIQSSVIPALDTRIQGKNMWISVSSTGMTPELAADLSLSKKYNLYETIIKENSLLKTNSGFVPDIVILNRDMTSHIPDMLKNAKQDIIPNPLCGWHSRQKFKYFKIYEKLASEFCSEFKMDSWLISALTETCNGVDFNDDSSLKIIADKVDYMLSLIRKKYEEYEIKTQPYVFIKASNGTYGMGIITATSGDEILNLNKKKRNKMKKIKEGIEINSVIIQEGVPTIDVFESSSAEPLIYYIGNIPTCYLYRCNSRKDVYSSLNSIDCQFHDVSKVAEEKPLFLWNVISKLGVLALALEIRAFHH